MKRTFQDTTHFALAGERLLLAAGIDPHNAPTDSLPVRPSHGPQCGSGDDADRCARCHRQNAGGLKTAERMRWVYSLPRSRAGILCALCGLPGALNLPRDHEARIEYGHTVSIRNYGATNAKNGHATHRHCNATAGDRDLRPYVPTVTAPWPRETAARAYDGTPWHLYVPDTLPTTDEMDQARAERVIFSDDGDAYGLPF